MIKFLSEIAPLIVFLVSYKYGDIQDATLYMLIAAFIGTGISYMIEKTIPRHSLISLAILTVLASITIFTGNSTFIKIKPTILYLTFAAIFLITAIKNRPFIKHLLNHQFPLKENYWNILSYRFAMFFFFMAVTNELVWRNFDEIFWVKFKVFGALPIMLIFVLSQLPFLNKHKKIDDTENS